MNKSFLFFTFVGLWVGILIGQKKGFKDGVESVEFDRVNANMKLQHCLRIVRSE